MSIITNLWSTSFLVGLVSGFLLSRLWCLLKTCWLNHRDGRHRSIWAAVSVDRRWLVGILAVGFLVWSVITTSENASDNQRNARDAAAFAERVQDCQSQLIQAIAESRRVTAENEKITADNDRLSEMERGLLADQSRALAEWLGQLIAPSDPRIAALDPNATARQEYGFAVSRTFFAKTDDINRRIQAIHDQQDRNNASRPTTRPALPEPNCGQ